MVRCDRHKRLCDRTRNKGSRRSLNDFWAYPVRDVRALALGRERRFRTLALTIALTIALGRDRRLCSDGTGNKHRSEKH
jgi:hypothetical protein